MVFLLVKISIPDMDFSKTIKINSKEKIYRLKDELIKKNCKNELFLNYGFIIKNQQPIQYLNEGKTIEDYNVKAMSELEFLMKRRLNIEELEPSTNTLSTRTQKKFVEEVQKKLYDKMTERLSKNFDPNFCTETGETPLTIAIQNNDVEAFNLLVNNGAFVDFRMNSKHYWMTPLHYSITIRNRKMINLLLKKGACSDISDTRGYTPLYLAVVNDENEYIKLLALSTTNFKAVDKDGNGLLHQAIKNKNIHTMALLIDCGADMDIINNDGNSALHLCVMANNKEMVKKLIVRGCNREFINNNGKTAKGIAGLKGYSEIFEILTNFNNTMIEPPPPPFEDKEKMITDLLDDSHKFNPQTLSRTAKLVRESFLTSNEVFSPQTTRTTKKKRKHPPPPPLPLFDLKNLNIEELSNNSNVSNSTFQINSVNHSRNNTELMGTTESMNIKSVESISKAMNNTNQENNENMLNKRNFEMMVNILYDMLKIINVEEKNVRTMEEYKNHIESKLARQKFEYSNYKILKSTNTKTTATE